MQKTKCITYTWIHENDSANRKQRISSSETCELQSVGIYIFNLMGWFYQTFNVLIWVDMIVWITDLSRCQVSRKELGKYLYLVPNATIYLTALSVQLMGKHIRARVLDNFNHQVV